jgi:hypothetical protein
MDLPAGMLDFIDQYVSEALETTGTRKGNKPVASREPPPPASFNEDTLIPIHIDFDDRTEPNGAKLFAEWFAEEEGTAFQAPALRPETDARGEIDALPRERAPRHSQSPLVIVEADEDEITNVVGKPTK